MPHVVSFITGERKISVYRQGVHGDLFDLSNDPGEVRNLWSDPGSAALKSRLLKHMIQGMLQSEPTPNPRLAGA